MINTLIKMTYFPCLVICLSLMLQINLATADPYKRWMELTPIQQDTLKPLAIQWDLLPIKLQKNLLNTTRHYPKLTLDQKRRFQSRLEKWSKLTPEQREHARNRFKIIRDVPRKHELIKPIVQEENATIASSVPAASAVH